MSGCSAGFHLLLSIDDLGCVEVEKPLLEAGDLATDLRRVEPVVLAERDLGDCVDVGMGEETLVGRLGGVLALGDVRAGAGLADQLRLRHEVIDHEAQLFVERVECRQLLGGVVAADRSAASRRSIVAGEIRANNAFSSALRSPTPSARCP
jgi:hypothetical protein